MLRLINAFKKLPSPSNRAKLAKYLDSHPMAVCMLAPEEYDFLKVHGFA